MARFNARFAIPPTRPDNLHRPLKITLSRLRDVLCRRELRYVGQQLHVSWQRRLLVLERNKVTDTLVGKHVEIYNFGDGRLDLRWNGVALPFQTFDKDQPITHASEVENKRLDEALALVKQMQARNQPLPEPKTNSDAMGYQRTGKKPGRRPGAPYRGKDAPRSREAAG